MRESSKLMSLVVNGSTISPYSDNVIANGQVISIVYFNGVKVWERTSTGSMSFYHNTSGSTFTVPTGVYQINVCASGGGGSGQSVASNLSGDATGGNRGSTVSTVLNVTPGQQIPIYVGAGGAGCNAYSGQVCSNDGEDTTVGTLTASGGKSLFTTYFVTDPYVSCGGSHYYGTPISESGYTSWGGEASAHGDGADGGGYDAGVNGNYGSGGGGKRGGESGSGGNGKVVISW